MKTVTESRLSRTINRLKQIWSELDYAQQRLFEIRTGIPASALEKRAKARAQIDELERVYRYREPRFSER
jgi:hypothetical protein